MQSRRVGTLTLGILLIVLGIIYILMTFFNLPLWKNLIDFWPLILISLGIEVLVLNNIALKNNIPLRYDFISFILIIVMFFFAFGTFAFSTVAKDCLNPSSPIFYRHYIR